jgi:predicted TIM-barrel fold metal-dependent hydrolase
MLVDAHCHIDDQGWEPQWFIDALNKKLAPVFGLTLEKMAQAREASFDHTGDTFSHTLRKLGDARAIVCVPDHGLVEGKADAPTPIEEINRQLHEIIRRHADQYYFAASVDPRRKNALQLVDKAVKEWGAVSLKLHPACGWYPNDKMVYPLYKKCIDLGIPVNFHTGPWYPPLRSKFSHPLVFEDIAVDFPELTIHCTHSGDLFFMDMVALAKVYHNIILDLAGWQDWLKKSRSTALAFYRNVRFILDMIGPRLVFASDWGNTKNDAPYLAWVKAMTEIPDWVKEEGIEFTKEEIEGYMGGNAIKLLRLATH